MRTGIGIVGLGMAVTPHAKALLDLSDDVEVAYAFSPSKERRASFAARFPFPLCEDIDTILKDDSVRAVLVLTPPSTHLDIARRCAEAGKHVLLEKPVEVTTARAEELTAACRSAGVRLGIVLQHRFRPAAMRLRDVLRSDELGAIVGCSTTIRLWRPQAYYDEPGRGTLARDGGGVLMSQGIHTLDLMLSLVGPVTEVMGYAGTSPVHRMETEDMVCAAVRFANGALGIIDATTAAYPGFPERIDVACERGTAALTGTSLLVQFRDGRKTEVAADASAGGTGADPMAFPHDYHRSVIMDFIQAIRENRDAEVSGEDALPVHRLIDALIDAGRSGRAISPSAGGR